ncbi:MAG: (2Fe-2S) ferredoxin domain-containing protein [Candidatus Moraniibacteriota bacterium]|nr:MAG: (2Fe-2S) ferredoxin domain-containing protein [Candidatus Moranbacteria bacterium]
MNLPKKEEHHSLPNAQVKVCVHEECRMKGSEKIYNRLARECKKEVCVEKTPDCFRFCKEGPNVAVNGNVLHHVEVLSAVARVRSELSHPSPKKDAIGTKSLDDLDSILDGWAPEKK